MGELGWKIQIEAKKNGELGPQCRVLIGQSLAEGRAMLSEGRVMPTEGLLNHGFEWFDTLKCLLAARLVVQ